MTTLVVGIGSPFGDDQAGWLVVDLISDSLGESHTACFYKSKGNGTDWFPMASEAHDVIFIDAVRSGALPGTLIHFKLDKDNHTIHNTYRSSHHISLPQSVELARSLGYLTVPATVYGIEVENVSGLDTMSEAVTKACIELSKTLGKRLLTHQTDTSHSD